MCSAEIKLPQIAVIWFVGNICKWCNMNCICDSCIYCLTVMWQYKMEKPQQVLGKPNGLVLFFTTPEIVRLRLSDVFVEKMGDYWSNMVLWSSQILENSQWYTDHVYFGVWYGIEYFLKINCLRLESKFFIRIFWKSEEICKIMTVSE